MATRLISSIHVEKLFGLYTYDVPEIGELSNAAILYGDNGVGKSTLLRIVFHLLSAKNNRGHRTALYNSSFSRLEVTLASGVKLTAYFVGEDKSKILTLEVIDGTKKVAAWDYHPRNGKRFIDEELEIEISEDGNSVIRRSHTSRRRHNSENVPRGEQPYLSALTSFIPSLFILNADRRLDSDTVSDPSDEVELRRTMQFGEPKRINELVVRSREIALSQALSSAARWLGSKAVIGTNKGSMNVHSVYGDVLRKLLSPSAPKERPVESVTIKDLVSQLEYIDSKTAEHARYELSTHLSTDEFSKALGKRRTEKNELAAELLEPYIKSVQGRLEAVEPIYQLIDRFITIINELLRDKEITFKLSQGFSIKNRLGVALSPSQLSSGEQQLLLLFCHVLTARDTPSVFMIDEPEISLNIKWQRQLVQSLLDIISKADIQLIFASHSIELLTQHRSRVVKLVNKS